MYKVVSFVPRERIEKSKAEIPPELEFVFQEDGDEEAIIEACRDASFLLVTAPYPYITERVLKNIPSVQMIQVFGAGFDKIDVNTARSLNIPVANTPGQNATTVAEFTIGVIIALQRKILLGDREVKKGNYVDIEKKLISTGLGEIRGSKIGLLGLGNIGRKVAMIASSLGAEVSYYDPVRADRGTEEELKVAYCSFHELLKNSEIISIHVPLNKNTSELISREEFALMRDGALIINTSRGEIVDQNALVEALEQGKLDGAAVDHFYPDPPPPEHPLLNLSLEAANRLLTTPHIAGVTAGSFGRMANEAVNNLQRVAKGEKPMYVVN